MERYRRKHPTLQDDGGNSSNGNGSKGIHNKSVLILDATATAFDIRYPTDLSLLNECRENTEKMIDELWEHTERKGHKTTYKPQKSACKIPESGKAAKNAQGGCGRQSENSLDLRNKTLQRLTNCCIRQVWANCHQSSLNVRMLFVKCTVSV